MYASRRARICLAGTFIRRQLFFGRKCRSLWQLLQPLRAGNVPLLLSALRAEPALPLPDSKGEELKFQFAFALSHHPVWLLLDEPTGNFDPKFRSEFLRLLKAFVADENHGIVLATHLTDDLDRLADYILYLEKGELLLSMDVEEMRQAFRLVAGETYKVRLLPEEHVILRQENEFGAKALVRHRAYMQYDKALHVASPSIEELMYFMTKRKKPLPDFNKDASRDTFS